MMDETTLITFWWYVPSRASMKAMQALMSLEPSSLVGHHRGIDRLLG
jgi:hypothetical protein